MPSTAWVAVQPQGDAELVKNDWTRIGNAAIEGKNGTRKLVDQAPDDSAKKVPAMSAVDGSR